MECSLDAAQSAAAVFSQVLFVRLMSMISRAKWHWRVKSRVTAMLHSAAVPPGTYTCRQRYYFDWSAGWHHAMRVLHLQSSWES